MRSIEQAFEISGAGRPMSRPRPTAARPAHSGHPARLTRRGRVVVVLAVLGLLVVAGFTLGRVSSQAAGPSRPVPTITVAPGQTLWEIAARVAPHADRRAVVRQLEQLNHLADGRVLVGQQLLLPR